MAQIIEIDPYDDAALRRFFDTERASIHQDRPDAVTRGWESLRTSAQAPNPYYRRTFLAAVAEGRTVGTCELGGSVEDNQHVADVEVNVLGDHRRRGIGRLLWAEADRRRRSEGRSTVCGEVHVPAGADPETTSAYAFARAVGFETVHLEDHLVLRLPVAEEDLERLRGRVRGRAEGYDVVTWGNRCPDAYVAAYCAMKSQMSTDVPTGEIDYQPIVYDEARLRSQEERTARSYDQLVAAARRPDGAFAGYTQMFLSRDDDIAIQDDTLVMPGHGDTGWARSSSSRRSGSCCETIPGVAASTPGPTRRTMRCIAPTPTSASGPWSGCTRCSASTRRS